MSETGSARKGRADGGASRGAGPRPPARGMKLVLAGSALLLAAGLAAFYFASSRQAGQGADGDAVQVTINAGNCDPQELTVPAGQVSFRILNRSERAVEWEILDGVMVVEERENIAPGFTQTLRARLAPGDYAITCGLLSNPRGVLHVTPTAESDAALAARPALADFVGALAEYRVYLAMQASALEGQARKLAEAVAAGRLDEARALYAPARLAYQRMETAADLYADLDARMDGKADYLAQREQDPAFAGFHRLEYGLFGPGGEDGLAPAAQQLLADAQALRQRVRELSVAPERLAAGASRLAADMASYKTGGQEDRYAHTDLSTLQGNLDGLRKVAALLQPLARRRDAAQADRVDRAFGQAQAELAKHRGDGGPAGSAFVSYERLDDAARKALAGRLQALADELGRMYAVLGLD